MVWQRGLSCIPLMIPWKGFKIGTFLNKLESQLKKVIVVIVFVVAVVVVVVLVLVLYKRRI